MLGKIKEDFNEEELSLSKTNLENEVYRLKSKVEDLEEIVAEYRARMSIIEEEEEELLSKVEELKLETERINRVNEDMLEAISKHKEEIVGLEEVHKDLNEIINSSYEKIEQLEDKQEELKDDIIQSEKNIIVNRDLALKYEVEANSLKNMIEIEKIKQSNLAKQAIALEEILERK